MSWRGGQSPASHPSDWLNLLPDVEKVIQTIQPDLIHAGPVPSCGFLSARTGFHPLLLMSWGSDLLVDAENTPAIQEMARQALSGADALICDAYAVRDMAVKRYQYPQEQIVQFPWGINLHHFAPNTQASPLRAKLGWEKNKIILSTRAWEYAYGVETLLEAFRLALQQAPELRLIMLSGGHEVSYVRSFIEKQALNDHIFCPGQIAYPELPDYYHTADLYLSCAPSDGVSISLLEALATGLPVVVTDIPGNREWVRHAENGWLFPPRDAPGGCRAVLEALCCDTSTLNRIRQKNRQLAETRADWAQHVRLLLATYTRLIHSPKRW